MLKINEKIMELRKEKGITQEQLATMLGISNQAVSKWEGGLNCPDIALIPELAKIFNVSISELFGEIEETKKEKRNLTNEDDVRIAILIKDKVIEEVELTPEQKKLLENTKIVLNGNCNCLTCQGSAEIKGNVYGNIDAGDSITCAEVTGKVDAGDSVTCGNVSGDVEAGDNVICGNVDGNVDAGDNVTCGNIGGDVDAGDSVRCGSVNGNIDAGENVFVTGEVKGNIKCESLNVGKETE